MFRLLTIRLIKTILWVIDRDHRNTEYISKDNDKKFTHVKDVDFQSDFAPATKVFRTVPYDVWQIKTKDTELFAADKHLIKTPHGIKWIQDLVLGDLICTKFGDQKILLVKDLNIKTHMYDLEIDSEDHLYYTNDVLSHNTTTAAGYLLWFAMFKPDSTILIAAHKYSGVQEIMQRIRYAYELCPNFIRAGVTSYNKGSIEFDNGSRIVAQATTENTGRGMSITCLSTKNTKVTVRDKITGEIKYLSIGELIELNKNPGKIRKTAKKHRGMKRSDESKKKMSIAAKSDQQTIKDVSAFTI